MADISKFPRGVPGRNPRANTALNATWADPQRIADHPHWKYKAGRIFLGAIGNQLIGIEDDRHLMTIAGSRAGKGVSTIIPNLVEYPGSVLVIDPKGENAQKTATRRGSGSNTIKGLGQNVYVLDPFQRSGHPTSHFNPLDMIKPESETAVDDAALIAEALIIPQGGDGKHWSDAARNFLRGLILFVRVAMPPAQRNLARVRKYLTLGKDDFKLLLKAMQEQGEGDDDGTAEAHTRRIVRRAADSMDAKAENEASGVISTAIEQTDFLDSPLMADVLSRSDFELADLKAKKVSIYLCLPAGRMATHNRWLRIIVNLAVQAMEYVETEPALPVLFIMDEFAVLDHLSSIEKAAGQIAGFGVRLWPILQDLSQLKSIYKDRWETFMGNAGLMQFFGNNDLTTLDYLKNRLGKSTIVQMSQSEVGMAEKAMGKSGEAVHMHETDLMASVEIAQFFARGKNNQLLLWPGALPIAIDRVRYYDPEDPFFHFFDGKIDR